MSWFGKDEIEATGEATKSITSGIRHMFTGEIPPETVLELNRMDNAHTRALWELDSKIPWWLSSRSIVMIWLNFHSVAMVYIVLYTDVTFQSPAVVALLSLTGTVNLAFFGSKGMEYIKVGKAP